MGKYLIKVSNEDTKTAVMRMRRYQQQKLNVCRNKPHWMLGRIWGPNLVTKLPVSFGSKMK